VKICGITRIRDALRAEALGAWAIGVVLFSDSPRSVSPVQARKIFDALSPSTLPVAVSNTTRNDELAQMLALSPGAIQIYHPFVLTSRHPCRVFRVITGEEIPSDCDAVVLDESHGSGKKYDPEAAGRIVARSTVPVILSGGLTTENITEAIQRVHPCAVDVSSGVESSPGRKDHKKMHMFLTACREACT
jgi:phosphoribosylanthranilate isomerase